MAFEITVVSDFICPWCWLGKRRLDMALERTGLAGAASVIWWPFELNPDMPPEGMDRRAYRTAKFGSWQASLDLDARIMAEAEADGIPLAFDRITRTPGTRPAHRLSLLVRRTWPEAANAFVDRVFRAYFVEGQDIGEAAVLDAIAADVGADAAALRARLDAGEADAAVRDLERRMQLAGVSGVPLMLIGGRPVHGARPIADLADALRAVAETA